jgi:hypothetical protein
MSLEAKQTFNAGTDWEFKVSDTLSNLIANNQFNENTLADYCYSAFIDDMVGGVVMWEDLGNGNSNQYAREHCGVYWNNDSKVPNHVIMNYALANKSDVVYMRNVLLYNSFLSGNEMNKTSARVVVDIRDIKKWYMNFDKGDGIYSTPVTSSPTYSPENAFSGTVYQYQSSVSYGATIEADKPQETTLDAQALHPCNILIINNEVFIGFLNPSNNYRPSPSALGFTGYSQSWCQNNTYGYSELWTWLKNDSFMYTASTNYYIGYPSLSNTYEFPDVQTTDGARQSYIECDNGIIARVGFRISDDYYTGTNAAYDGTYGAKDKNTILKWFSWCGLKFKSENTMYKPIIEGGIIIGYTSDMTTPSEFDQMTNVTGNNIPVIPPSPVTPSGDAEIEMPLAYIGGTAGMVDYIKINAAGLASADDIASAISRFDIATIGKDLLRNFVAFKCFAVLNIDDSVVRDIKVAGHTLKDENDNALQGEYIGAVKPIDFTAGTINPMYNDYRDYAPYTRIQMYVPFCGWFDLPSWCMGKHITGTMFTDLYNGTVKAVIYASQTVVAEVGGCCAFDIPFAAESTGMKAGAVISSALNTVAMTGATIAAPNIATGISAVSSAANFISAANSNGTTLKGVMGDGSNTNGLLHVYIKTTRPNSPAGDKKIPDTYKHEYGIPCYKELTLSAGDGFTQIMDANITGAMTDREKQMIIDGFKHGLIL